MGKRKQKREEAYVVGGLTEYLSTMRRCFLGNDEEEGTWDMARDDAQKPLTRPGEGRGRQRALLRPC
jgi:hypothetical protein